MFVGVGAARVRDLFAQASAKSPCIIFIDELDALGKARGFSPMGGYDEREQTLNQLLTEMDGFDTRKGVIIMGATNRPEILDPGAAAPGPVRPAGGGGPSRPGGPRGHPQGAHQGREARPRGGPAGHRPAHARLRGRRPRQHHQRGRAAGRPTPQERRGHGGVQRGHRPGRGGPREAQAPHQPGARRRSWPTTRPATRWCRSASASSDTVQKISIVPRGIAALGYTIQLPTEDRYLVMKKELEERLASLLGGRVAEEMFFNDISTGAQNDLRARHGRGPGHGEGVRDERRWGSRRTSGRTTPSSRATRGCPNEKEYSEQTAAEIDDEVRRILEKAHATAKERARGKAGQGGGARHAAAGEGSRRAGRVPEGRRLRSRREDGARVAARLRRPERGRRRADAAAVALFSARSPRASIQASRRERPSASNSRNWNPISERLRVTLADRPTMPSESFSEQAGTRQPASRSATTEPGPGLKLAPSIEISRILPATRLRRAGVREGEEQRLAPPRAPRASPSACPPRAGSAGSAPPAGTVPSCR